MLEVSVVGSIAFLMTMILTKALIHFARPLGMIDAPNERSSHLIPTPKGGGLSFFIVFTLITTGLFWFYPEYDQIVKPLLFGGPFVVILGWLDDRYTLSALVRLVVHFFVAIVIYYFVTQGFTVSMNISFLPNFFWINFLFCIFFIAWFINLYNFMDGADGLASSTAIAGSALMAVVCYINGSSELAMIYCLIAYTVSGFLVFNWTPAKIFMGDTGSYFLGFLFASLALISKAYAGISFYSHIIIFGFFIFDTTYVLFRRIFRLERVFNAHKMFLFHKLMAQGWSHRKVSAFYTLVLILWLFPLSNLAAMLSDLGLVIVAVAYLPLLGLSIRYKSGEA